MPNDTDEETLWERGALGDSSPKVLLHTVWYWCVKLLGVRGKEELGQILWTDMEIKESRYGEYVEFNEWLMKTRDGKNNYSREFRPKLFPNNSQPERCPVRLFKLYKSHRPGTEHCQAFFLTVNANKRAKHWYSDCAMGVNTIGKFMTQIAAHGASDNGL